MELSNKQKVREVMRCMKNPIYFITNYVRIQHPIKGWIPFHLYPFQEELIKVFLNERLVCVNKARQMGLTTLLSAYACWMISFQEGKKVGVLATKQKTAAYLIVKIKDAYNDLPKWMQIHKPIIDNATSFRLSNKSSIDVFATSKTTSRGIDASLIILDEAAHIEENMEEFWGGLKATTSEGGSVIVSSTPNGAGNWFCNIFEEANEGINGFKAVEIPWWKHPKRDQKWFEEETKPMSKRMVAQEYLCSFNLSGETFFDPETIEELRKKIEKPIVKLNSDRCLWIWEDPVPEKKYLISADVATGNSEDYSAFHIIDVENFQIVGDYKGKIQPDYFGTLLFNTGLKYNGAMIAVEYNSYGAATALKLVDLEYPNLYYSKSGDHINQLLAENGGVQNAIPGFMTTSKNRILILSKLEEYIRKNEIKINSERFFNECRTFTWNKGRPQAQKGRNDDLIMSLAIGVWVRETALIENQRYASYKNACINSIITTTTKFDTSIPGMEGYNAKTSCFSKGNQKKKDEGVQKAKLDYVKYGWLL